MSPLQAHTTFFLTGGTVQGRGCHARVYMPFVETHVQQSGRGKRTRQTCVERDGLLPCPALPVIPEYSQPRQINALRARMVMLPPARNGDGGHHLPAWRLSYLGQQREWGEARGNPSRVPDEYAIYSAVHGTFRLWIWPPRSPASAFPPEYEASPRSDSPATSPELNHVPPWQSQVARVCPADSGVASGRGNRWRCQAITVRGWTKCRASCQPGHRRDSHTQKRRSIGVSRGRATVCL
jgi:hypothetical protein